eukprot:scaffold10289_cov75-Skeletonema_marinoi.AAC.3
MKIERILPNDSSHLQKGALAKRCPLVLRAISRSDEQKERSRVNRDIRLFASGKIENPNSRAPGQLIVRSLLGGR